ncbi:hypothetical protein KP509_16G003100 [Ceratopteris richardii]|uniref:Uncharacterized protein n=1 Tax=Ceratopteris richardii TaxID=49495 RepID=A0A8T2SXR3_CERRI|nr:hypothetical protein KP509_16G003100 [Ceratopteris richardii]
MRITDGRSPIDIDVSDNVSKVASISRLSRVNKKVLTGCYYWVLICCFYIFYIHSYVCVQLII